MHQLTLSKNRFKIQVLTNYGSRFIHENFYSFIVIINLFSQLRLPFPGNHQIACCQTLSPYYDKLIRFGHLLEKTRHLEFDIVQA